MKSTNYASILCMITCVTACAAGPDDAIDDSDEQGIATQYLLIQDFNGSADQDLWFDLRREMNAEFDQICGDTFCEGDYSNIRPLTFSCAVSSIRGSVRDCAWTFVATQTGVDATTALIGIDSPTFECHMHPRTTAHKLIALLAGAGSNAIQTALPGMGSIYDTLGECFDNPINQTPLTVTGSSTPTYVAASSYYASAAGQQKWRNTETALVAGFDQVCGDTFCSSDYSDLQAMELVCAITKSTGNVKRCSWVFGGSYPVVSTAGAVVETSHSFACPFTIHGTLSQLINTLTAPGTIDAIRRPLPGVTATAYDALLGCLP